MSIIEDAQTGRTAKVDVKNRLAVFSISQSEDKFTNVEGDYNSIYFSVTPAGANDYFLYLQNTGSDDLMITDFRMSSSVATRVNIHKVSGTPSYVTGTDAEITNRNLGSLKTLTIDVQYDTDITSLTDEGTIFFEELPVANTLYHTRTTSNIIITQGQAIALERVAATGLISCVISITKAAS